MFIAGQQLQTPPPSVGVTCCCLFVELLPRLQEHGSFLYFCSCPYRSAPVLYNEEVQYQVLRYLLCALCLKSRQARYKQKQLTPRMMIMSEHLCIILTARAQLKTTLHPTVSHHIITIFHHTPESWYRAQQQGVVDEQQ